MTVAQLIDALAKLPQDAVVLMENGGGLSLVSSFEFMPAAGQGAPAEVILQPNMSE
jgi:hypothetical protein